MLELTALAPHQTSFDDHFPSSKYGLESFHRGQQLIAESDLDLGLLVFDADEVLWDWVMETRRFVQNGLGPLLRQDFGHREHFLPKPGMFEFILGMHGACVRLGRDPWLRIWTNGYPWRIWEISRFAPSLRYLLGPDANGHQADTPARMTSHPRLFTRVDFVDAVLKVNASGKCPGNPSTRVLILNHVRNHPTDSTLKIPELATLVGKPGFSRSLFLVDDQSRNVRRFVSTGRMGVVLVNETPFTLFGKIPNTTWDLPRDCLVPRSACIVEQLARAFISLAKAGRPNQVVVHADGARRADGDHRMFAIDVPDWAIRQGWINPMARIRNALRGQRG